jgi:hypothetical protein
MTRFGHVGVCASAAALAWLLAPAEAAARGRPATRYHPPIPPLPPSALTFTLGNAPPTLQGRQARGIGDLIHERLGLDARWVPISIVDQRTLDELHRAVGGRLKRHVVLNGFEYERHIYVKELLGYVDNQTLVHETLHALSHALSDSAQEMGYYNLIEGVTEYLARRVLRGNRAQGLTQPTYKAYGYYVRFAEELVELIGEPRLIHCFFESGLDGLRRDVDARLGAGALDSAARALQVDELGAALNVLSSASRRR